MDKDVRNTPGRHWLILQYQRLRGALSGPRWRALSSAAITLAVLLPVWWLALRWYADEVAMHDQRIHVADDLLPYAYWLTEDFHERAALLMGLRTYLALRPPTETLESDLGDLGTELLDNLGEYIEGFQSLWIAPGGVVRYVYPPTASQEVLGRNLMADQRPGVREDVERAIQSRRLTLSDQEDLGLDSPAWVVWLAVDYDGDFWGLVATWLDPTHLSPSTGTSAPTAWLQLALRDDAGKITYGPASVFETDPVIQVVEAPSGRWELAAVPKDGWEASIRDRLVRFEVVALVITVLVAGMAYMVSSRQAQLAATVKQRTLEISRVNRQLREDIARREESEAERERLLLQLEQRVAERTHHLKTLYDVTAVANASLDLNTILEQSLDRIVAAVGGEVGTIHLYDVRQGGLRATAPRDFRHEPCSRSAPLAAEGAPNGSYCRACVGESLAVGNTAADAPVGLPFARPGARAHLGLPIRGKGHLAGVLCLFRRVDRPFGAEEATLLAAIAEQLGGAVENARLFRAAQDSATLEERQRLAAELHDSVTQLIYSDVLLAEAARLTLASGDVAAADRYLARLGETAQQALKEMRLLLFELRSPALAGEGLTAALQRRLDAVEKRAGVEARLLVDGTIELPPPVEEELHRIALEALNNALKHAVATSVTIELRAGDGQVEMKVSDNGRGFDPSSAAARGGLGLTTMRERARRLGSSLLIESTPGAGAAVRVRVRIARGAPRPRADRSAVAMGEVSG